MIRYRPEIDGLRTLAVLAVVIYHAQFSYGDSFFLTGGYLGVDIFFVISGFLITSIILRELQNSTFSFLNFYERRARRILPSLFTVITCSIPFAWWLMLPEDMQEYAGSLLSSLFFGSNFWFWLEDSYVAEPSLLKPFLHTWSLSVEEQFYVIFPIVLLVLWRFGIHVLLIICAIASIGSLFLAQWASSQFVDANFYLLPSRAWELMGGAILAILKYSPSSKLKSVSINNIIINNIVMFMALALMLVPMVIYDHETLHPSLLTVFPVFGVMLVIQYATEDDWVTRLLASPIFVTIGKWSYSFYLWHFPIFAFARIEGIDLSHIDKVGLIFLSLFLAGISYYLIESTTRSKTRLSTLRFILIISIWFIILVAIFTTIYQTKGLPNRLGPVKTLFESAKVIPVMKNGRDCDQRSSNDACVFADSFSQSVIINVGDSHSKALAHNIKKLADGYSVGYMQLTEAGCPLIRAGFGFNDSHRINNCHLLSQNLRMEKIHEFTNSIVIYSGRYSLYLSGERFNNTIGGAEIGPPVWMTTYQDGKQDPEGTAKLVQNTIVELLEKGHKVVLIYPVPEAGWDIPKLVRSELDGFPVASRVVAFKDLNITTPYGVYKDRSKLTYAMYDGITDNPNLVRIYPSDIFCNEQKNECYTHNENNLYYEDDNHLSPYGAKLLIDEVEKKISDRGFL